MIWKLFYSVLVFLFLSTVPPAGAWGPLGHKVIARIAEERLSPRALEGIHALLGESIGLDRIANCADWIHNAKKPVRCGTFLLDPGPFKNTGPWHYINVPITADLSKNALMDYCPGGENCVLEQIRTQEKVLKDSAAPASRKQAALMFLVHLAGDEHQPLHCATEINPDGTNDRGGNDKPVVFQGKHKNLHQIWDGLILAENGQDQSAMDPEPWVRDILGALDPGEAAGWTRGNFTDQAALESFKISRDTIYPDYKGRTDHNLDLDYQEKMQPIARRRLAMAGVRLGALLEDIFGLDSPGAAPWSSDRILRMVEQGLSDEALGASPLTLP